MLRNLFRIQTLNHNDSIEIQEETLFLQKIPSINRRENKHSLDLSHNNEFFQKESLLSCGFHNNEMHQRHDVSTFSTFNGNNQNMKITFIEMCAWFQPSLHISAFPSNKYCLLISFIQSSSSFLFGKCFFLHFAIRIFFALEMDGKISYNVLFILKTRGCGYYCSNSNERRKTKNKTIAEAMRDYFIVMFHSGNVETSF